MKLEFIDKEDMKRVWSLRWAIATAIIAAIPVAYMTLPYDWTYAIPDWLKITFASLTMGTAITTAVTRVIKQPEKSSDKPSGSVEGDI